MIAWIAEHCTQVADAMLIKPVHGADLLEYEEHVGSWTSREPEPGDSYPDASAIVDRWTRVCDWIIDSVARADDQALQSALYTSANHAKE